MMRKIPLLLLSLLLSFTTQAAEFFTDFDEFATGTTSTQTSGTFTVQDLGTWTSDIADLGAGDHVIRSTGAGNDTVLIVYDAFETTGPVEVVLKLTLTTTGDQNAPIGPALIAADGQAYAWRPNTVAPATTWRFALFNAAGAIVGSNAAAVTFSEPAAGTPFWLMIGRDGGGNIYGSAWINDGERPGSPMASGNANATLTTVKPGMYAFDSSDDPIDFLIFGAGESGSAAPETEPGGGGSAPLLMRRRRAANDDNFDQPLRAVGF